MTAAPPGAGPAVGVAPTASLRHTGTYLLGAVAIAALVSVLMRTTFGMGLLSYREVVLRKPGDRGTASDGDGGGDRR